MSPEELGLLADLKAAGFPVEAPADLYIKKYKYQSAIPVLLDWLPKISDPGLKEEVVRALAVKWAKGTAAKPLIAELSATSDHSGVGLAWAIANALAVVAEDEDLGAIEKLLAAGRFGKAREMLVLALGNMRKSPHAVTFLIRLLDDEDVAGHAIMALRKLGAKGTRSSIEPFLSDPRAWVRKEAKKALEKLS